MRTKIFIRSLLGGLLPLFSLIPTSAAAPALPVPPRLGGNLLPPGRCSVEALNVGGIVSADGSMFIPNVPTSQEQFRVRVTCADPDPLGAAVAGQSLLATIVPGGAVEVGAIDFGTPVPIAASFTIAPLPTLTSIGASTQLAVTSVKPAGDVTAASTGTTYRSSNPKVATVSPDGLVTAQGSGTATIQAINEGATGLATVRVRSAPLLGLSVAPASVAISRNPLFASRPVQLQTSGLLSDGEIIDLTLATSGTTYSSGAPGVAAVSPDGAVVGVSPGATMITVTDGQTGSAVQVPVMVTAFSPSPFAAYDTPGIAHNVDISGALAFVADDVAGLQILDTSSGGGVGKLSFDGRPVLDVRLRGTLAAVALGAGGFGLADVSNPERPRALSTASSAGNVGDLWVSGHRLYAASSAGLLVYDIANPAAPTLVGSLSGFSATAVAADSARGVAVVLTSQPAIKVIRTSAPAPWPVVTLPLPQAQDQADDVILFGTRAIVANGRDGLHEVDVTNPASPVLSSSSTLSFNALGVAMQTTERGTIIAVADNWGGGDEPEADVGLGSSEQNGIGFRLGDGQLQDIGGPTSCGSSDATCAAQYPETVYVFIR